MTRTRPVVLTWFAVVLVAAAVSRAAVTVEAYYRMGEAASATPGSGNTLSATDSSGNARHLANAFSQNGTDFPHYVNPSPMFFPGITPAQQSAVAVNFPSDVHNQRTSLFSDFGVVATTATDNFGIEFWINLKSYPHRYDITTDGGFREFSIPAGTGDIFQNGFHVTIQDTIGRIGITYPNIGSVSGEYLLPLNEWHHIAWTRENGITRNYVDGVEQRVIVGLDAGFQPIFAFGKATAAPLTATSRVFVGGSGFSYPTDGIIDEVRFFTFAPGTFSASELLVPKPAAMGVLLPALACLVRRARR